MPLRKVISGGQTGADQAGLVAAKRFGLETGGQIPKGFRTLTGPRPDLGPMFGITEHASDDYAPRTYCNVHDSDGTVRLAGNFSSRGEVCTKKAIDKYKRHVFDVDLTDPPPVRDFVGWLTGHDIGVLNVAGNAEETFAGCFRLSMKFLCEAFFLMGLEMSVSVREVLAGLGLDPAHMVVTHQDKAVSSLTVTLGPRS
jgi:hypothetical protein